MLQSIHDTVGDVHMTRVGCKVLGEALRNTEPAQFGSNTFDLSILFESWLAADDFNGIDQESLAQLLLPDRSSNMFLNQNKQSC